MNGPKNFAKRTILQVTMREMQTTLTAPRFWIGLLCVTALLTVSGPFDTAQSFTTPQRAAYWAGIAVSTYFLALVFMVPMTVLGRQKGWNWVITALGAGLVAGPPVGLLVYLVNTQIAGIDEGGPDDLIRLLIVCTIIAMAIACLRHLIADKSEKADLADPTAPRLMKRLKPESRGDVMSLNAQDHYVEVVTTRGKELILMRLGDAVGEMPGIDGRRIHRSWWVAKEAVVTLAPYRGKLFLDLKDGRTVPVSRSNEKMVMDWLR